MALTNAQIQAAYRARQKTDEADAARLDIRLSGTAKRTLERLARHCGNTQKQALEALLEAAELALLKPMDKAQADKYFDR